MGRVALPRSQRLERSAEIVLRARPSEWRPLARPFLQRQAISRHSLLEGRRPHFPVANSRKRKAEIVLRRRPVERRLLTWLLLERRAIGCNRLLQLPYIVL